MKTKEAAKDPKRNPKKRRANHAQRPPGLPKNNGDIIPKNSRSAAASYRTKATKGTRTQGNAHRTTEGGTDEQTPTEEQKTEYKRNYKSIRTDPAKSCRRSRSCKSCRRHPGKPGPKARRHPGGRHPEENRRNHDRKRPQPQTSAPEAPQRHETTASRTNTHRKPKTPPRRKL